MGAISWTEKLTANQAKRVLWRNPNRKSATIFNNSAAEAYVGYQAFVATSGGLQGIPVKAGGGAWTTEEPELWTGEVWIISGSSITINIMEESKEPWVQE